MDTDRATAFSGRSRRAVMLVLVFAAITASVAVTVGLVFRTEFNMLRVARWKQAHHAAWLVLCERHAALREVEILPRTGDGGSAGVVLPASLRNEEIIAVYEFLLTRYPPRPIVLIRLDESGLAAQETPSASSEVELVRNPE